MIASAYIFTEGAEIMRKGSLVVKIVTDSADKISALAADMIAQHAKAKPGCAMAFAAGRATERVYAALAATNVKELSECSAFTVCEYEGLAGDDERSCSYRLGRELYSKTGITRIYTPTADNAEEFDAAIAACGGLELAVLGIGTNGHIGFNEPATPYDSYTHETLLTDKTKQMNAELFGGAENVPDKAVTMGLKTICSARNVILVAFGSEKAEIIHQLVYGKTSTYVPAAMLQMHMNMTLLLDEEAAEKIK